MSKYFVLRIYYHGLVNDLVLLWRSAILKGGAHSNGGKSFQTYFVFNVHVMSQHSL